MLGKDVDDVLFKSLLSEHFEKATINIGTLMTAFNQVTSPPTETKMSWLDKNKNNLLKTMYVSYQDPNKFGNRINNRIAFLMADQQRGE